MSWMDSWSRPQKSQAAPPPYYLTNPSTAYCHTCGRIIGQRRANTSKSAATEVKFCSDRCKRTKPSTAADSLDVRIELALTALLQGLTPPPIVSGDDATEARNEDLTKSTSLGGNKKPQSSKKGDPRILVPLSDVETAVFGDRQDPEKTYGRRRNRAFRGVKDDGEWKSVDMIDRPGPGVSQDGNPGVSRDQDHNDRQPHQRAPSDSGPEDYDTDLDSDDPAQSQANNGVKLSDHTPDMIANHVRPPQSQADVNFAAQGGERGWGEKIAETPEMLARRREGQKRAEEKELVRQVARRAVVFGLLVGAEKGGQGKAGKGGKKGGKKAREAEAQAEPVDEKVRKKCEAVMSGSVVEPSFAKGDWEIRWRDDLDQS